MKQVILQEHHQAQHQLALRNKEPRASGIEAHQGGAIGESALPWSICEKAAALRLNVLSVLFTYRVGGALLGNAALARAAARYFERIPSYRANR